MDHEVIWEGKGIYWKYKGTLTGGDLLQTNMDIYGDPRFDKLRYQIVDMLEVEVFDVATESMEEITIMDIGASQTNSNLIVAVVATQAQGKHLVEIYETVSDAPPWETELFETVEEARGWITSKHGITFK